MFSIAFDIETESFNIYPTATLFDRMHWTSTFINRIMITYKISEQNVQDGFWLGFLVVSFFFFFPHNFSFWSKNATLLKKQYFFLPVIIIYDSISQRHYKSVKYWSHNIFFIVFGSIQCFSKYTFKFWLES